MEYTYDFGDCWYHVFEVVGRAPRTQWFECVDGQGMGAAEDVGSPTGWAELKESYRATRPTKEQKEEREWFETMCRNGDPRGIPGGRADEWDKDEINERLIEEVDV